MVDWAAHYDRIYAVLGVPAVLTRNLSDGGTAELTVIDKTAGIETGDGVTVSSVKPGAAVRIAELSAAGLVREDLHGAAIAFNGGSWEIKSSVPRPSPAGEAAGELYLILSE